MRIYINNQEVIFEDGITLDEVMTKYNPHSKGMAAAINNKVVSRSDWRHTMLRDGDRVIIISAVCGG